MNDELLGLDGYLTREKDPGTGDGRGNRKLGRCLDCGFKGGATAIVFHAATTKHRVEYNGVKQEPVEVKTNRVGIFYYSLMWREDRTAVPLPGGGNVYVRVEVVTGIDLSSALDVGWHNRAGDEGMLNTEYLPELGG